MMILFFYFVCFFFFKQKTAYEMRISDWSSDVCSSDLPVIRALLSLSLACLALPAAAQPISAADRGRTIDEIARLLEARYVDAEKGRRLAAALRRARGQWEAVADGPPPAKALTGGPRPASGDGHFAADYRASPIPPGGGPTGRA